MKISSLQENLKSCLNTVSHIAGKNVNLPILNNIMLEVKGRNIRFIATDLEIGIVSTVRGKVEKEGVYTVDSKVISEYISLLPNKKIDIDLKENKLKIQCENYKTVIKGQSAEDFPLIPQVEKEQYYKVNADEFKKALSQVVFAISNSETRVELSGALFNFKKDQLILAATDSYRLAECKLPLSTNGQAEKRIIIPAKTIQEVIRILSNLKAEAVGRDNMEVEIYVSENQILFTFGSIELVSRLIEGQYPDYEQIIPASPDTRIMINKAEFVRAVKASAIFSKTGINDVNLDFPADKNRVTITSESSQVGENTINLEASVKGKDNGIVINYRYLLDGINNIDTTNLRVEVIDGATPCVIRPEKEDSYLYVIMPIKQ